MKRSIIFWAPDGLSLKHLVELGTSDIFDVWYYRKDFIAVCDGCVAADASAIGLEGLIEAT